MPYIVKRSHYANRRIYATGQDFPGEGLKLPAEQELLAKIDAGLIEEKPADDAEPTDTAAKPKTDSKAKAK